MKKIFLILGLLIPLLGMAATEPFQTFLLGSPNASSLTGAEVMYCSQGGSSTQCTAAQLLAYVKANLSGANLGTPSAVNLTNATALPCAALPALTGNVTTSAGSCATTLTPSITPTLTALWTWNFTGQTANASVDEMLVENTTPALVSAQQFATIHMQGQGWKTTSVAGSEPVDWRIEVQPVQGTTTPTSTLVFSASVNGGAYVNQLTLPTASAGTASITAPFVNMAATQVTSMSVSRNLESVGTTFTASGCSNGTLVGGAWSGTFVSGTTGTCTVTITQGGIASASAHGMNCFASDRTTPANAMVESSSTTTSCTISGTTVTGDVIQFAMVGY